MRILVVCLGNICRSPAAAVALRLALEREGLDGAVEVDSAGTGTWHLGEAPDRRMVAALARRGLTLTGSARRVTVDDFAEFDLLLAMDHANLAALRALAPDQEAQRKIRLFRSFVPDADGEEVPDPFIGDAGFDHVTDIVIEAADGVVAWIQEQGVPAR
jgi:protein-tyrosine phosphatase